MISERDRIVVLTCINCGGLAVGYHARVCSHCGGGITFNDPMLCPQLCLVVSSEEEI